MLHTDTVVSLPSLGQDVQLGMLFDARTLSFFSGVSLWNDADINGMQEVTPNQVQHAEYKYTYSLDEARTNAGLDVEASLSLDLGLLKVEGSAKYLNKKKTSSFEARVDISCTVARRTRRIPQEKLANISYENRLDDQRFTHYVAEVVEGGSATLSFTQSCKSAKEKDDVQGRLEAVIEAIPISGEATLDFKSDEKSTFKNIRATYSGAIAERVTSVEDAHRVASEMPEKLAQQMNTLSYVLVPLSVLDSNCARRIRMLDGVLVQKTINALASGEAVQLELDTLHSNAVSRGAFPTLQKQISGFKVAFESVSTQFSQDARRLLPELRDGTTDYTTKIDELSRAVALFKNYTDIADKFVTKKLAEAEYLDRTIAVLLEDGFKDYLTSKREFVSFLDPTPRLMVSFGGADISLSRHPLQNLIEPSTTSTQEPSGDGSSRGVDTEWFENHRCALSASCTKLRNLRARLLELGDKAPIVAFGVTSIDKALNKSQERVDTEPGDVVLDYEGRQFIVTNDIPGRLEKDGSMLVPAISDITCTSSCVEIPWSLRGEAAESVTRTTAAVIRRREKSNPGGDGNLEVVELSEDGQIDKITQSDLKEDCDYEVQICFLTVIGPSEWSATTIVHTPKKTSPATTSARSPIIPTTALESPRITPHPPRRHMLIKSVSSGQYLNGRNPGMQDPLTTPGRGYDLPTCTYFHWVIGDAGNGNQFIKSISSGQYLDGRNPGMVDPLLSSGSRDPHSDRYLQWKIGEIGNGLKSIKSVSSGRYLDGRNPGMTDPWLSDGTRDPATDVYLQWVIDVPGIVESLGAKLLIKSVSSGQYLNGRNPGMQDPLTTSGRGYDLPTCTYFHWVIGDAGNGNQFIKSISSGQYLDGRNPGMVDPLLSSGSRDPHSDRYLQWKIGEIGNGLKSIKSVSSGRYLDGRNPGMTDPWLSDGTRDPATDAYLQWKVGMTHVGEMP